MLSAAILGLLQNSGPTGATCTKTPKLHQKPDQSNRLARSPRSRTPDARRRTPDAGRAQTPPDSYSLASTRVPEADGTEPRGLVHGSLSTKLPGKSPMRRLSVEIHPPPKKTRPHREALQRFFPSRSPPCQAGKAPAAQEGPQRAGGFYTGGDARIITATTPPIGQGTLGRGGHHGLGRPFMQRPACQAAGRC